MLRAKLKSILILVAIATLLTGFNECNYQQEKAKWTAKMWAGSSKVGGFVSSRREVLRCDSKKLDAFAAVTWTDIQKVETEIIAKCDRWKTNDLARAIMRVQEPDVHAGESEVDAIDLEENLLVRDRIFNEVGRGTQ